MTINVRLYTDKRVIGFDVETHGTNPWKEDFLLLSAAYYADEENKIAFGVNHPGAPGSFFVSSWPVECFTGHGLTFDRVVIEALYPSLEFNHGYNFFDSQVAQILIDENISKNSLRALAERYLDEVKKINIQVKKLKDIPIEKVLEYNLQDARVSRLLYDELVNALDDLDAENNSAWNQFSFLMETQTMLVDMQCLGVSLDQDWTKNLGGQLQAEIESLVTKIHSEIGPVLLTSPQQLGRALFASDTGFEPVAYTEKTKQPKVDLFSLSELRKKHPETKLFDRLIRLTKARKLKTTYADPLLDKHLCKDGKIHGRYHLARGFDNNRNYGTVTGRLSSSEPNLTNVARDKRVKGCFVPPDGYLFCSCDYSQLELRVAAWLSRDEAMLDAIRERKDMHTSTLALMEGMGYDEAVELVEQDAQWKENRVAAKTFNFANLYGGSIYALDKILRNAGVEWDMPRIKNYKAKWDNVHRGFVKWANVIHYIIDTEEQVVSEFGMVRRVPRQVGNNQWAKGGNGRSRRQGLNFLIQGPAAQITIASLNLLHLHGGLEDFDAKVVLTVHDSVLAQYNPQFGNAEELLPKQLRKVMTVDVKSYLRERFPRAIAMDELYLDVEVTMGQERWTD